ncbi:MAG: class I SAM-dependent methyltransferase, partial [Planctomycetota bacterium]
AAFALAALSPFGEQLAKGGEPAVAAARAAMVERFTRHLRDGIVAMDAAVWIVTGGSAPVQRS